MDPSTRWWEVPSACRRRWTVEEHGRQRELDGVSGQLERRIAPLERDPNLLARRGPAGDHRVGQKPLVPLRHAVDRLGEDGPHYLNGYGRQQPRRHLRSAG